MIKKPGLGRGLDVLLSGSKTTAKSNSKPLPKAKEELKKVAVEKIKRGKYQPRSHMDPKSLQELADSIKAQGMVQPVVVRPVDSGYELIAGERRWRAAQIAGMHEIPAVIRDIPDQAAAAMSLIENIQREDLNPLEEATALKRLIDEFGLTHQVTADSVGRSRAAVSNLLRLLDLELEVKALVDTKQLEMGHARALLALKGKQQIQVAEKVAQEQLSVRVTESLIKSVLEPKEKTAKNTRQVAPEVKKLEQDLSERLGAAVLIKYNNKGKGKLVVNYNSLDELDGILERIQ